jgi:hypothetical protein
MLVLEEQMRIMVEEEKKYQNKIHEIEKKFGSLAFQALPDKILLCEIKLAQQELTKAMSAQKEVVQEEIVQEEVVQPSELMHLLVEEEKKLQKNIDEIEKQFGSLAFQALPDKILFCKNKLAQEEEMAKIKSAQEAKKSAQEAE